MIIEATQSPEADLDREIEKLIGDMMRGTLLPEGRVRLGELQSRRAKLLRPMSPSPARRPSDYNFRRFT